jgi:serpin B
MNAFTSEAYKQLAQGGANLILSPFNIATALSMALAGARGKTAKQIQDVLDVCYDATYDRALRSQLAGLAKAGNAHGNELLTANGLWVQNGLAIHTAFEKTLADNYQAPPMLVDFIANPEAPRS